MCPYSCEAEGDETETDREDTEGGGGRVTVEAEAGATGPEPRNRGRHQSCKEGGRTLPQDLPRRQGPAHTLILDIWPPEPGENKCLWFEVTQHMVLCNDGSRK